MVTPIRNRQQLLRFLRNSNRYAEHHMLGCVVFKETPHGSHTGVVATVRDARREEVASFLFSNRHAVLRIRQVRFVPTGKMGRESVLRPAQACKLIRDYFKRMHGDRITILQRANYPDRTPTTA